MSHTVRRRKSVMACSAFRVVWLAGVRVGEVVVRLWVRNVSDQKR
jgi:hypothetical protein